MGVTQLGGWGLGARGHMSLHHAGCQPTLRTLESWLRGVACRGEHSPRVEGLCQATEGEQGRCWWKGYRRGPWCRRAHPLLPSLTHVLGHVRNVHVPQLYPQVIVLI